eukprot:CAMPEP_0113329072 /NCGR_PEP_ID=MMETSP0010_2-20120614/20598_1 /TAXON_ID=216773 ORGANISM="Corethron hystrix, Strain 308" /NCGR_SAMPLE_ID=MMETSP0010_2 /ASSEMBLY_ACC=CAM_ASM_000155 /LENGTH=286 /DNA_ID=CAMNT_0000190923 /DNA_START=185 /DNA_END=1041 /DNA_ORIENTATION=+ /assembly_acc=CAM_ASM_000155
MAPDRSGIITPDPSGYGGQTLPPSVPSLASTSSPEDNDDRNTDTTELLRGLALTRRSVLTLNLAVTSALVDAGLPAVGISPFASGTLAHGGRRGDGEHDKSRISRENFDPSPLIQPVADALRAGLLPVVHGDACLYGLAGSESPPAGILSGDTILSLLATYPSSLAESVSDAVFLTDVDGVYTSNPRTDKSATLVEEICVDAEGNIAVGHGIDASGSRHGHDVTGGMTMKLGAAATVARYGVPVIVVRCGSLSAETAIQGQFLEARRNRQSSDNEEKNQNEECESL